MRRKITQWHSTSPLFPFARWILTNESYLFGKAKIISELRSPTEIDGAIARALWHMAKVIENDKKTGMGALEQSLDDARNLKRQAETAKTRIRAAGKGRALLPAEEENPERAEEVSYDLLLPLFFR